jgi:amino acid transporter
MPDEVSRVNRRFGTPHVSLLATGIPIAALTLAGRVEILAEVASFLHLVIYGLLCIGLIVLRRSPPGWYDPSFRSPGYPVVPAAGAAACFGLIAFMNPLSWLIGLTVVCGAALWHFYYGRDVKLRGAEA